MTKKRVINLRMSLRMGVWRDAGGELGYDSGILKHWAFQKRKLRDLEISFIIGVLIHLFTAGGIICHIFSVIVHL